MQPLLLFFAENNGLCGDVWRCYPTDFSKPLIFALDFGTEGMKELKNEQ